MNGRNRFSGAFGTVLFIACFALALVSAVVTPLAMIIDGNFVTAGLGLSTTGVWIAIGFFVYAEKTRQEFEACLEERLCGISKQLKNCECKCQQDSAG